MDASTSMSLKVDASTCTTLSVDASTTATSVYQFKIALHGINPPIWRRIQVPDNFTFFELHVAIEDLFQWSGQHLHKFEMEKSTSHYSLLDLKFEVKEYIGIPDRSLAGDFIILPEKETRIADQFSLTKNKCVYTYDFGSEWRHVITLEKILVAYPNVKYPLCVEGARQPPPEDQPHRHDRVIVEPPFSINSITFRDPEVVWCTTAFQNF